VTEQSERHVPAAGRRGLEALYDPVMALTVRERAFRAAITDVALTASAAGPMLDLGCGTGSQLLQLARLAPGRELIGIDVDTAILERARGKLTAAGVSANLQHGSADALPLADASVAIAIASLVLHHLTPRAGHAAVSSAAGWAVERERVDEKKDGDECDDNRERASEYVLGEQCPDPCAEYGSGTGCCCEGGGDPDE